MSNTTRAILLVEDNEDDVFLMRRAFREAHIANPVSVVEDGQAAIEYLSGIGKFNDRATYPVPAIAFLDVKLPYKSGIEVLAWIRQQKELDSLIVIMLTASNELFDINQSYTCGANSYLVKPPMPEQLLAMAKAFKWYWLEYNRHVDC